VFGHMHHLLRRHQGERLTFLRDAQGTAYLNCACVPRHGTDQQGRKLRHFSWVRFEDGRPVQISHRWYGLDGTLLYRERLWQESPAATSGPEQRHGPDAEAPLPAGLAPLAMPPGLSGVEGPAWTGAAAASC